MNENNHKELNQTPPELEIIVSKFERLSLTLAPTLPSLGKNAMMCQVPGCANVFQGVLGSARETQGSIMS